MLVSVPLPASTAERSRFRSLRSFLLEAWTELIRLGRTPSFAVPVLLFPVMFYVLFGVLSGSHRTDQTTAAASFASMVVFGVIAPGLFGLGVTLAVDRDRGLLKLRRALPSRPALHLLAKISVTMGFALIVVVMLTVIALAAGRVRLEPTRWLELLAISILGVVPFCALGLLVGTLVKAQAAPTVLNLIYLPMSYLSGLWMPLSALPPALARVAPLWPAYHLEQLALRTVEGAPGSGLDTHVFVLAGLTVVFFALARRRLASSA